MDTDVWEGVPIVTPHYKFELQYKAKLHVKKVYDSGHLFVGQEENPCLSVTFSLPEFRNINSRFASSDISVAHLNKIKNMKECILENHTTITKKPSFAKEMLDAVITEIKKSFPFIHHLKLQDASYIPCDGDSDTLDLLFYNIALYKKAWYEENFHAYFISRDEFIKYRCAVEKYASPETKSSIVWADFYHHIFGPTKDIIRANMDYYESLYNTYATFPEFFIALSKNIDKKDKCAFFRNWLEVFLQETMNIPNKRTWYIDLYTVEKKYTRGGFRKTRKQKHY